MVRHGEWGRAGGPQKENAASALHAPGVGLSAQGRCKRCSIACSKSRTKSFFLSSAFSLWTSHGDWFFVCLPSVMLPGAWGYAKQHRPSPMPEAVPCNLVGKCTLWGLASRQSRTCPGEVAEAGPGVTRAPSPWSAAPLSHQTALTKQLRDKISTN